VTTTQIKRNQGPAPTTAAAAAVGSGGTFGAATYFWKVTALTQAGESAPSNEASVAIIANGSANLTWVNPSGTYAVRIYRGTATGAENVLVAQIGPVQAFTDTNLNAGAATPPAVSNFAAATKTAGAPTKANEVAGVNSGLNQALYAGLVGWCQPTAPNGGTVQQRNGKVVAGAGFAVQEV